MDLISGISTVANNVSMSKVSSSVGMRVLKKALDNAESNGSDMIKLMEQSANPDLGSHFDETV